MVIFLYHFNDYLKADFRFEYVMSSILCLTSGEGIDPGGGGGADGDKAKKAADVLAPAGESRWRYNVTSPKRPPLRMVLDERWSLTRC